MSEEFVMTEEEKRIRKQEINEEFLKNTPMTREERQAVKKWMAEGHCIGETVESKYFPGPSYPPQNFLEVYRQDKEMEREMEGMTQDQKEDYLWGNVWTQNPGGIEMPEGARKYVRKLNAELFNLWRYLDKEELWDEASEFLEEHRYDDLPFDVELKMDDD